MKCATCGGPMIQKNRLRLFVVGLALLASPALALVSGYFLPPGIVLALGGAYLVVWATLGKGGWCRQCKKFSLF